MLGDEAQGRPTDQVDLGAVGVTEACCGPAPLEVAVAIGVHPYEMLAASYKAPIDVDGFAISGGLHGAPVELVRCRTVDLEVPADAEVVLLEGELLPIGWTADEEPDSSADRGRYTFP